MSFDALKVVHRVTPVQTGVRYSITLYTPGKLDRLTAQDWDVLARKGFPIYLYDPLPAKMRRLTTPSHVMNLNSESEKTQAYGSRELAKELYQHRSHLALLSHHLDENLVKPKTLLDCCKDAQEFMDEYVLNDGHDKGTLYQVYLMRVWGQRTRMLGLFHALEYHAESNDRHGYLWTLTNMLRLTFHMANEAGLETVFPAAYSLKHASDMEKSFPTQEEAFDKAKEMGLSLCRLFFATAPAQKMLTMNLGALLGKKIIGDGVSPVAEQTMLSELLGGNLSAHALFSGLRLGFSWWCFVIPSSQVLAIPWPHLGQQS